MTFEIKKLKHPTLVELNEWLRDFETNNVLMCGLDTETTGLHIKRDMPFMTCFGWITKDLVIKTVTVNHNIPKYEFLIYKFLDTAKKYGRRVYAWNCKFDMHMLDNAGFNVLEYLWGEATAIVRLGIDADLDKLKLKLKTIAKKYLSSDAGEDENKVKQELKRISKRAETNLKVILMGYDGLTVDDLIESYEEGTLDYESEFYPLVDAIINPSYAEVDPEIMFKYGDNDVVIMLQLMYKFFPFVQQREQMKILQEELDLIPVLYQQERIGFKVNVPYLMESKERVREVLIKLRKRFVELAKVNITSGQHNEIKKVFLRNWGYDLPSVNKETLPVLIRDTFTGDSKEFAILLMKLRTYEKWYTTYILRYIRGLHKERIYTQFNSTGTVSGRFSSDFQQFPKKPLKDDDGNELFHPRKLITPSGGGYSKLFFLDFSQMELRVTAHYTILVSGGDPVLCGAYIPFGVKEEDWTPTDLHGATAINAFGESIIGTPEFKSLRNGSKSVNFGCLYGASTRALCKLPHLMDFTYSQIDLMRQSFHKTFAHLKHYRDMVRKSVILKGYVQNAFGRRYYVSSVGASHKLCNYLIQGSCADMVKIAMTKIHYFLKENNLKTRMIMSVHDEIGYEVYDGEEWVIPKLQEIQQQAEWCKIPMVSEIEYSTTNWGEKQAWEC